MSQRITILLAFERTLESAAVQALLQTQGDFSILGTCDWSPALAGRVRALRPHLLVTQAGARSQWDPAILAQIRHAAPMTRVLVIGTDTAELPADAIFQFGAAGYVMPGAQGPDLLASIRSLAAGSDSTHHALLVRGPQPVTAASVLVEPAGAGAEGMRTLSARERQVLGLIAEGLSTRQIAARLKLGTSTVATHRLRLKAKLSHANVAGLTRCAVRHHVRFDLAKPEPR